jgi:MFS family permease
MNIYLIVSLAILIQIALKGSRMLLSLYAIDLGASPFVIGVLIAMYAVFPLLLALTAGKTADRVGPKWPLIIGSFGLSAGLAFPAIFPGLQSLYFSPALIGIFWIFFHVSSHQLVGSLGEGPERVRNFANFSLGASVAGVAGPLLVGLILDTIGPRQTYATLAAFAAMPGIALLLFPRVIPPHRRHVEEHAKSRSVNDLLANPDMRRNLLISGLVLTGIDLYGFYLPLLGRSLGLSSAAIGVIVSMPAVAAFSVRLWMPRLVKRFTEEGVLTGSLALASVSYFAFPIFHEPIILAMLAFMMGLGLGCGQPLTITLSYNYSPPGRAGEALGLRLTVNKFTQIVVPVVFGSLGAGFGLYPVFWSCATMLATGSALNARRAKTV